MKPVRFHENQQPTRNVLVRPTLAQQVESVAASRTAANMAARIAQAAGVSGPLTKAAPCLARVVNCMLRRN